MQSVHLIVHLAVQIILTCLTHRCAHHVAHAEIKATLLVHGVMQTRELWQGWPLVVKWVITQTVVGTRENQHHYLTI